MPGDSPRDGAVFLKAYLDGGESAQVAVDALLGPDLTLAEARSLVLAVALAADYALGAHREKGRQRLAFLLLGLARRDGQPG